MLSFSSSTKIFAYIPSADMRKGFTGLSGIIRKEFQADPTDGSLFLFINKRRDRMKLLHFTDGGFWLYHASFFDFFQKSWRSGIASHAILDILGGMQDLAQLSKPQLLEKLDQQFAELASRDKEVARRDDVIQQLEAKISQLEKDYLKLWQERFAAKSERYIGNPDQLRIDFGDTPEAADAAEGLAEAIEEADLIPEHKRRKPRKKRDESLPAHLPRQEVIMDAPDTEKQCETHGEKKLLPEAMWDVVERLKYIPPQLLVEVQKYPKYACEGQPECGIATAERPTGIVEGDKYDTTIAAEIITNKYAYHRVQGKAVFKMRGGLSRPGDRTWSQTGPNCGGKEPSWEALGLKGAA